MSSADTLLASDADGSGSNNNNGGNTVDAPSARPLPLGATRRIAPVLVSGPPPPQQAAFGTSDVDRRCDEYAAQQRLLLPRKRRAAAPIGPPVRISLLVPPEGAAGPTRVRARYAAAALDAETVRPGDFVLVARALLLPPEAGLGGFVARVDEIYAQAPGGAAMVAAGELRVRAAHVYVQRAGGAAGTSGAPLLEPVAGGATFAARAIVARCLVHVQRSRGAGGAPQQQQQQQKLSARGLAVYACAAADAPRAPAPPLRAGAAQLRLLSLYVQFGLMLHDCACAAGAAGPRAATAAAMAACGRSELLRTLRTDYVRRHQQPVCVRSSAAERAAWRGRLAVRPVAPPPVAWRCSACLAAQRPPSLLPQASGDCDECFDVLELGDDAEGGRVGGGGRRKRALYLEEDMPLQVSVCARCAGATLAAADLFAHAQRCAAAYATAPKPPPPATIDAWFATLVRLLGLRQ